jgi:hypothetical protein
LVNIPPMVIILDGFIFSIINKEFKKM